MSSVLFTEGFRLVTGENALRARAGAARDALRVVRRLALAAGFSCAALGCSEDKAAPPPPASEARPPLCPTGLSEDPPRSKQEPAIRAFGARDYVGAQRLFAELAAHFPGSAAARAWQGDAVLFDKDLEERAAARAARPFYEEAERLHQAGCKLQRRPRYYLLMGEAYAALRLAKAEGGGYDAAELDRAQKALEAAQVEFPTSAEAPYNLARVECARAQLGAQVDTAAVERCLTSFRVALEGAERLDRPRFLRTHRSTQDWIVRSRTQSEFTVLRVDPRYEQVIRETLAAAEAAARSSE